MNDDLKAIACNSAVDEPAFSKGSLAYVQLLAGDRAQILIRSRSGRWIEVWRPVNTLANFRFKTIAASSPLFGRIGRACSTKFISEEYLSSLATFGAGQGVAFR